LWQCFGNSVNKKWKCYHIWPHDLFYFDSETISGVGGLCFEKILATLLTPGDLAWEFSDLEMTWLFHCAGAATGSTLNVCHCYMCCFRSSMLCTTDSLLIDVPVGDRMKVSTAHTSVAPDSVERKRTLTARKVVQCRVTGVQGHTAGCPKVCDNMLKMWWEILHVLLEI